jgi:hypothetical protein
MSRTTRHRLAIFIAMAITLAAASWIVEAKGPTLRDAPAGAAAAFGH